MRRSLSPSWSIAALFTLHLLLASACSPAQPQPTPTASPTRAELSEEEQLQFVAMMAKSHAEGNVPDEKDFAQFLRRDLTAFLSTSFGELSVEYELLRDQPTQAGVGYPHYYVWLTGSKGSKTVVSGAARVSAIERKEFRVDDFLTSTEIQTGKGLAAFPEALQAAIRERAGLR